MYLLCLFSPSLPHSLLLSLSSSLLTPLLPSPVSPFSRFRFSFTFVLCDYLSTLLLPYTPTDSPLHAFSFHVIFYHFMSSNPAIPTTSLRFPSIHPRFLSHPPTAFLFYFRLIYLLFFSSVSYYPVCTCVPHVHCSYLPIIYVFFTPILFFDLCNSFPLRCVTLVPFPMIFNIIILPFWSFHEQIFDPFNLHIPVFLCRNYIMTQFVLYFIFTHVTLVYSFLKFRSYLSTLVRIFHVFSSVRAPFSSRVCVLEKRRVIDFRFILTKKYIDSCLVTVEEGKKMCTANINHKGKSKVRNLRYSCSLRRCPSRHVGLWNLWWDRTHYPGTPG